MGTPGTSVVVNGGRRGVLASGKSAVFNAAGVCPACCSAQGWSFTDLGFIDGGQGGAYRAYEDPAGVPSSPWTILNDGLSLRLDWEDDKNCRDHNPNTQYATATGQFAVSKATILTVDWSGMAERHQTNYELMNLYVDGQLVGSARAPGGFQGCAGMGPVVSNPTPPLQVHLDPGPHTLFIDATTNDQNYHFDAWYRFDLTFEEAP